MGVVNRRHLAGVFLGGLAAWGVILGFLSLYSVIYGYGFLAPFQGARSTLGFNGTQGLVLLILIDLIIPLVAGFIFLGALFLLSRTNIAWLSFATRTRALGDGLLLGFAVWALLYIPVLFQMSHPTLAQAVAPLVLGLIDHLAFGATLVLVIFSIGGPVPFGDHPTDATGA
jgi:hypothetical protein